MSKTSSDNDDEVHDNNNPSKNFNDLLDKDDNWIEPPTSSSATKRLTLNQTYAEIDEIFADNFLDQITADHIKDPNESLLKKRNVIATSLNRILNYVNDRLDDNIDEIKYSKFYDFLISIGCDPDEIHSTFEFLEITYDNYLNLKEIKDFLVSNEFKTKQFAFDMYLQRLRLTALMPNFIDAFMYDNQSSSSYNHLSDKLLKFLNSHRLPSNMITNKYFDCFANYVDLLKRFTIAQEYKYQKYLMTSSRDKKFLKSADCIKYYKVCCAKQTAHHLFDDELENTDDIDDDNDNESLNGTDSYYWETNKKCEYNTAHWVLFELRRNVQIKKLLIKFNHVQIKTDDLAFEYTIDINYGFGSSRGASKHLKTVELALNASNFANEFLLLDSTDMDIFTSNNSWNKQLIFKLTIKAESRGSSFNQLINQIVNIKLIKLIPAVLHAADETTDVGDHNDDNGDEDDDDDDDCNNDDDKTLHNLSFNWFFDLFTTMALIQTQHTPQLYSHIVNITKRTLAKLKPLSMCTSSLLNTNTNANFILSNRNNLTKIDGFLRNFLQTPESLPDSNDGLLIYLKFNMARGHLKNILMSLKMIMTTTTTQSNRCLANMLTDLDSISEKCLRKTSSLLKLDLVHIDRQENAKDGNRPEYLFNSNKNRCIYMADVGKSELNIMLKSDKLMTLTSFVIKLPMQTMQMTTTTTTTTTTLSDTKLKGGGVKDVLIVLILPFDKLKPLVLPNVEIFGSLNESNYLEFETTHNDGNCRLKIFHFKFNNKQNKLDVKLPIHWQCKYVFVKLLNRLSTTTDPATSKSCDTQISLINIKFYGFTYDYEGDDILHLIESTKADSKYLTENGNTQSIFAIICFLSQLAERHKSVFRIENASPEFLNFTDFELNDVWQLYESDADGRLQLPILILFYELVNCNETRTAKLGTTTSRIILDKIRNIILHSSTDNKIKIVLKSILLNSIDLFYTVGDLTNTLVASTTPPLVSTNIDAHNEFQYILFNSFFLLFINKKASISSVINFDLAHLHASPASHVKANFDRIEMIFSLHERASDTINKSLYVKLMARIVAYILYKMHKFYMFTRIQEQSGNEATWRSTDLDQDNDYVFYVQTKCAESKTICNGAIIDLINTILLALNRLLVTKFTAPLFTNIFGQYLLWLMDLIDALRSTSILAIVNDLDGLRRITNHNTCHDNQEATTTPSQLECLKVWTFSTKNFNKKIDELNYEFFALNAKYFLIEFDDPIVYDTLKQNQRFFKQFEFHNSYTQTVKVNFNLKKYKYKILSDNYLKFSFAILIDAKQKMNKLVVQLSEIRFTCKAYGHRACGLGFHVNPTERINLILSSVIGRLCSNVYHKNRQYKHMHLQAPTTTTPNKDIVNLNSYLYKILLRNGKLNGGESTTNTAELLMSEFLANMDKDFLQACEANYYMARSKTATMVATNKIECSGKIKQLINTIFGLLIWHMPQITTNAFVDTYVKTNGNSTSDNDHDTTALDRHIDNAYRIAQSFKVYLIEQQQQICSNSAIDDADQDDGDALGNKVNHLDLIRDKCLFLLKLKRRQKHVDDDDDDDDDDDEFDDDDLVNDNHDENDETAGDLVNNKIFLGNTKMTKTTGAMKGSSQPFKFAKQISSQHATSGSTNTSIINVKGDHGQLLSSSSSSSSKPSKTLAYSHDGVQYSIFNHIFAFIFDDKLANLALIDNILEFKLHNSRAILALLKYKRTFLSQCSSRRSAILYLKNFFHSTNKANYFLDSLWSCGTELEGQIRSEYIGLIRDLLTAMRQAPDNEEDNDGQLIHCYSLYFLNQNWKSTDVEYLIDLDLSGFYLTNCVKHFPIKKLNDVNGSTIDYRPIDVLENLFKVATSTVSALPVSPTSAQNSGLDPGQSSSIVIGDHTIACTTFDLAMYPANYKALFVSTQAGSVQLSLNKNIKHYYLNKLVATSATSSTGSSKTMSTGGGNTLNVASKSDTDTTDRDKYICLLYIVLKYFFKLKVVLKCSQCEQNLVGNRYICLDCITSRCKQYMLCFYCYTNSMINFQSNYTNYELDNDIDNGPDCSATHNNVDDDDRHFDHKYLLLDHCCNHCSSLIIGLRIHCTICIDYDLCLACYIQQHQQHDKTHAFTVIQPTIWISTKRHATALISNYMYIYSEILYSVLTLKLVKLLALQNKSNKAKQPRASLLLELNSHCLKLTMTCLNSIQANQIYAVYSQEYLVSLLTTSINQIYTLKRYQAADGCFDGAKCARLVCSMTCEAGRHLAVDVLTINDVFTYLTVLLFNKHIYIFEDIIYYMLINSFGILLEHMEPCTVDLIVQTVAPPSPVASVDQLDGNIVGERILAFLLTCIEQTYRYDQIDLAFNYIQIFNKLTLNAKWSVVTNRFLNKLFASSLTTTTGSGNGRDALIYFLNTIFFLSTSTYTGQIFVNNSKQTEYNYYYKYGLIRSHNYDQEFNEYNIYLIDILKRNYIYHKSKKYSLIRFNHAFNVSKVKLDGSNLNSLVGLFVHARTNVFAKLAIITLINEYLADLDNALDDDQNTAFYENPVFLQQILTHANANTGLNKHWLIEHLKLYLYRLLIKDDFNSILTTSVTDCVDDIKTDQANGDVVVDRLTTNIANINLNEYSIMYLNAHGGATMAMSGSSKSANLMASRRHKHSNTLLRHQIKKLLNQKDDSWPNETNDDDDGDATGLLLNDNDNSTTTTTAKTGHDNTASAAATRLLHADIDKYMRALLILNCRQLIIYLINKNVNILHVHTHRSNTTSTNTSSSHIYKLLSLLCVSNEKSTDNSRLIYNLFYHRDHGNDGNTLYNLCLYMLSTHLMPKYKLMRIVNWKSTLPTLKTNDYGFFKLNNNSTTKTGKNKKRQARQMETAMSGDQDEATDDEDNNDDGDDTDTMLICFDSVRRMHVDSNIVDQKKIYRIGACDAGNDEYGRCGTSVIKYIDCTEERSDVDDDDNVDDSDKYQTDDDQYEDVSDENDNDKTSAYDNGCHASKSHNKPNGSIKCVDVGDNYKLVFYINKEEQGDRDNSFASNYYSNEEYDDDDDDDDEDSDNEDDDEDDDTSDDGQRSENDSENEDYDDCNNDDDDGDEDNKDNNDMDDDDDVDDDDDDMYESYECGDDLDNETDHNKTKTSTGLERRDSECTVSTTTTVNTNNWYQSIFAHGTASNSNRFASHETKKSKRPMLKKNKKINKKYNKLIIDLGKKHTYEPFIALKTQSLKWKFIRTSSNSFSMNNAKIHAISSKQLSNSNNKPFNVSFYLYTFKTNGFDTSYFIINELFSQYKETIFNKADHLNKLWSSLIDLTCLLTDTKRIKLINLLIQIVDYVDGANNPVDIHIDIFKLKPLRYLLHTLEEYKQYDKSLLRALYDLFFKIEKLVIRLNMQHEYHAKLKTKQQLLDTFANVAANVFLIQKAIC